jgi:hypothetical protein
MRKYQRFGLHFIYKKNLIYYSFRRLKLELENKEDIQVDLERVSKVV